MFCLMQKGMKLGYNIACSKHVDVQVPLLHFDFNKSHLIGYLDVTCSGGFLSLKMGFEMVFV